MEKVVKKIISCILVLSMTVSLGTTAFASESNINSDAYVIDELAVNLKVNTMTAKEKAIYQEVMNQSIAKYSAEDPDFNEKKFTQQVNGLLCRLDSVGTSRSIYTPNNSLIKVSIPNSVVATAVNIAVSLIAGGVTTAAIKAYVVKVGAKKAITTIAEKVIARLLAIGIKEVSGVGTVIRIVIKNVLDPGSTVAKYLDDHDSKPGNNCVDVSVF